MRKCFNALVVLTILVFSQLANAQTTGSISGTVIDLNGAVVPNATITVKGQSGQEFTATTSGNGTYNIPARTQQIFKFST